MTDRIVSAGHKWSMLCAAIYKRLLQFEMSVDERLRLLEELNNLTDDLHFTDAMLAAIQPMSDIELKMVDEAMALDGGDERCNASFKMLTNPQVFGYFQAAKSVAANTALDRRQSGPMIPNHGLAPQSPGEK